MVEGDVVVRAYAETRKQIEKKRAQVLFTAHLAAFIIGNVFLSAWNALTYFVKDSPTLWFFLPLLFWGIGVIIHYLHAVALFDEWWDHDERVIREHMRG